MTTSCLTFKIKMAYHGVLFAGYAIQQPQIRSVQNELQSLLSYLLKQPISLMASGRTDKGVHALEQVCSFQIKNVTWKITAEIIETFLIKKCPRDIHILKVEQVSNEFHAQFSAKSKTYLYVIDKFFDLQRIHLAHYYKELINPVYLNTILQLFVGEHDFLSFSTTDQAQTIKKINFIKVYNSVKQLRIEINGQGFLRSMVRMIVGTSLACMSGQISQKFLIDCLKNPQKGKAGKKAPACGLYLKKVYY